MFYDTQTLIVVCKDELLINQIKKLVETNDDSAEGEITGTRDNSIKIVAWTEKVWLAQKKSGNITNKVLFIGDIKGMDKLIPVLDVKFSEYGVSYGWAGNQAVVFADMKTLKKQEDYQAFLAKLAELPVPEKVKNANKIEKNAEEATEVSEETDQPKNKNIFAKVGNAIGKAGEGVQLVAKDLFKDKKAMEQQMLFYGIINLYNKDLENFMHV